MKVCLLAVWSDSLTYTIARALTHVGHLVTVWLTDAERDRSSSWSLSSRIAANAGASVVVDDNVALPDGFDVLIVQGHPALLTHRAVLDRLAPLAREITAISSGDRSKPARQALTLQWREWRWYGRWFGKVRRVAYKDGFRAVDALGLLRPRRVVGFDAHSKFLQDADLFRAIHAQDWDPGVVRPVRANFIGSRDPASRSRILDSVESRFVGAGTGPRMVWHAYSDAQPAALSGAQFLQALTDSDFTLSPPGYSLVTHRPVEALLRGSIPVLNEDELDLYALDLVDGVNCIAVPAGGWPAAIDRILRMGQSEIVAMRRRVQALVPQRVDYGPLARDMGARLGVTA